MKRVFAPSRLLALAVLFVVCGAVMPGAFAQVTIPAGKFGNGTVCPYSTDPFPPGCQLASNGDASISDGGALRLTTGTPIQIASAWAITPQTVSNGFTTTFTFQFSNQSNVPADGIAFVIHNAQLTNGGNPLTTIGYTLGTPRNGGPIGYGEDDSSSSPNSGIPNSIAVELDTYQNGWDPNANHIAVQSCGTGNNTSHHGQLCSEQVSSTKGINSNLPLNLADGFQHSLTIKYIPANATPCNNLVPTPQLCVYLDIDSNTSPVVTANVDIASIGLVDGTAYLGFTGATGGSFEAQDVLSWSFAQTVTALLNTSGPTPLVFNTTPDNQITHTLDYSNAGTVTLPLPTPQIVSTNVVVSGNTDWPPYVIGTPYAISHIFPKNGDAAIGGTGTGPKGSIYKNACFDATHPPSDANCPFVTEPTKFIVVSDAFDIADKPAIEPGTTTALLEYRTDKVTTTTDWTPAPSGISPNPVCTSTTGTSESAPPTACDLLDILVNTYGDATTVSGTTKKKGTFASVYGVPMPLTTVLINGTPLNNPPTNDRDTKAVWFKGPIALTFTVNPATIPSSLLPPECPSAPAQVCNNFFTPAPVASESYTITDLFGGIVVPTTPATPPSGFDTTQVAPVTFTAPTGVGDGQYIVKFSAADNVGIVERQVQLITAAGKTCPNPDSPYTPTGVPCYQTTLYQSQLNIDSAVPAVTCASADGNWHAADVSLSCNASDDLSGIKTATVATTPGAPIVGTAGVTFSLQTTTASGTANANASTNTQALCDYANNCSNTLVTGNKIDKEPPTIGAITLSPAGGSYTVGQVVIAKFADCTDGAGSGLTSCLTSGGKQTGGTIDTSTSGPHSFTVTAVDKVGNTTVSPAVMYSVAAAAADLYLNEMPIAPDSIKKGTTGSFYAGVVNLSSPTATNVVITTQFTVPSGVINGSVSASYGTASCSTRGCSSLPSSWTACSLSGTTLTCNVGQLASTQSKGKGIVVKVSIPVLSTAAVNTKFTSKTTVTSASDPHSANNSYVENYTVTNK